MNKLALIMGISISLLFFTNSSFAQVKIDLKRKIEKATNKRANKKTDKTIEKAFDKTEEAVDSLFNKKSDGQGTNSSDRAGNTENSQGKQPAQKSGAKQMVQSPDKPNRENLLTWNKYDFVPGDKIIFEDNLMGEENGEFPSRWDLMRGTVENAEFGGENIIMFRGGAPIIVPYLKNPAIDYLPDVFTAEFDLFINNHNSINVFFYDRKNQKTPAGSSALDISHREMILGQARSTLPGNGSTENQWAHISIAYTNGKMKAYIDETRLINIPHLAFDPTGISIHAYHASDQNQFFIKNFRLAEGGVKYYDRFLQDGKIVSNGVRFDVGKASLRPESMGVLNEIYKMLSEHPEVNVSIEGHTDSDGDNNLNQRLSEDRAKAVMNQLESMGIPANRLSSKGFGESMPINTNATPEGKAENRRVEFVRTN